MRIVKAFSLLLVVLIMTGCATLSREQCQRGDWYSIGMADGGHNAANVYNALQDKLAPIEYHVFPRHPLPVDKPADNNAPEIPALLKGYLRFGVKICGAPAWDPDFNTADLLIMLDLERMDKRYGERFFG